MYKKPMPVWLKVSAISVPVAIVLILIALQLIAGGPSEDLEPEGEVALRRKYYLAAKTVAAEANAANRHANKERISIDWRILAGLGSVSKGAPDHAEALAWSMLEEKVEVGRICNRLTTENDFLECRDREVTFYKERPLDDVLGELDLLTEMGQVLAFAAEAGPIPAPAPDWEPEPEEGWAWPVPGHTFVSKISYKDVTTLPARAGSFSGHARPVGPRYAPTAPSGRAAKRV